MAKKKSKRMHSEDARFLRDFLFDLMDRVIEIENAVGVLQGQTIIAPVQLLDGETQTTDIIECGAGA